MKNHFLRSGFLFGCLLGFTILILPATAQTTVPNEWTWQGGSNTCCQAGVYGTEGTPAAGNIPSSRFQPATATDSLGNFWLFGGIGSNGVWLNDLWELNPSTKQWTWVNGSNTGTAPGNWGIMGSAAATNIPSTRNSAAAWIDSKGNFWLFGGRGLDSNNIGGLLNDLWKYNPSTKQWTWMDGSNSMVCTYLSVYSKTICYQPATSFSPGGRDGAVTWTDSQGNLWLFGGDSYDSLGTPGIFNDFWEYSTSSNSWTFMGGVSQITCLNMQGLCIGSLAPQPQYGTLGVPASGNNPGGRTNAAGWTDSSGNLWIFGGEGEIQTGALAVDDVFFNDVWKYNFSSSEWTWMAGTAATSSNVSVSGPYDFPGVYETLGVSASGNTPGSRNNQNTWTDKAGNFWLFGGEIGTGFANDLWVFNPDNLNWTWMGGSTTVGSDCPNGYCGQPANYGALGTAAAGNTPGGRAYAGGWTDSAGNFWLFGGGYPSMEISYNDLWEYQPSANSLPPAVTPAFNPSTGSYTSIQSVTISNGMSNASIYYSADGSTPTSGSTLYTGPVAVSATETLKAIAIANGYPNSGVGTAVYTLHPPAATPTFRLPSGTYTGSITITLSDATPGAAIYYTTDGSTPTTNSTVYSNQLTISSTETVNAIASASGYTSSAVATAIYTINLPPPSFTVSTAAVAVAPGATTGNTSTITLTPAGGFTGNVALTAVLASSPSGAVQPPTLSFGSTTPVSITSTAAGTATLTISTIAASSGCSANVLRQKGFPWTAGGATLACLLLFGIPARRRGWRTMLGMLVLLTALAGGMTACGGGGGTTVCSAIAVAGTTPGAYTITVTGTSGTTTETGTVTLTVQ